MQRSTASSEKEYNKKFEIQWGRKFEDPDSFKQLLWNETGPTMDAMVVALKHFREGKAGNTAEEKIQFLKKTIESLGAIKAQAAEENSQDENPDKTQLNTDTGAQELDQGSNTPLTPVDEGQGGSESSAHGFG